MNSSENMWKDYRSELLRFIRGRVRDKDIAEDLVHEVLIKAYSHRSELADSKSWRAWIYQITRNALIDFYRKERPTDPLPEDLAVESDEHSVEVERQLALCMRPLLKELPEKYGKPLLMSDLEGIKQQVIAERMGMSLSGVKSRIQRGRRMLKDVLLGCCQIEFDHKGAVRDVDMERGCGQCGPKRG